MLLTATTPWCSHVICAALHHDICVQAMAVKNCVSTDECIILCGIGGITEGLV